MNMKQKIIDIVAAQPGLSRLELFTSEKILSNIMTEGNAERALALLQEIIDSGEVVEIRYTSPSTGSRLMSMLFPRETEFFSSDQINIMKI